MAELEVRIPGTTDGPDPRETLLAFAGGMDCELTPLVDGWLLLPEIMLRKHGVFVFPTETGCRVCREEDATTWEDFLMMKLAHFLAEEWGAELWLEGRDVPLTTAPHKFETFDHYVETVVEREPELVRDMKKYWLYAHRKRSLR